MTYGICKCCRRRMQISAYGWCSACYKRWHNAGRPETGPPPRPQHPHREPWVPELQHAKQLLALYGQLVTQGATPERISWEMSLGERQIQRYAAAWQAQQQQEQEARP